MKINKAGLELIKSFEGCHLTAYKCPADVWTIGYGHTLGVYEGMKITQAEAEQYLKDDMTKYESYVKRFCKLELNENQFSALVSFTYNCGVGNLQTLIRNRNTDQIAEALLLYNKAKGKVLTGLVRRRKAERELFLSGSVVSAIKEEVYDMPVIKVGSRGKAVMIWQIIIGAECDGIFGSGTESATKSYQKKNGLTVDGIVGKNSWKVGLESV